MCGRRVSGIVARFEDATVAACDLLNASFSIPHCSPSDFPALWGRITASIRPAAASRASSSA
jgi:hypothetical protein